MIIINWKAKAFETQISEIYSDTLREFAIEAVNKLPDYFFEVAASSSGKYHPAYALGAGGLVRHTHAAVNIAIDLLRLEQYQAQFTENERDCMIIALMLHDGWKHGRNYAKFAVADHPVICADWLVNTEFDHSIPAGDLALIHDAIATHMGQWNTKWGSDQEIMEKPKTPTQQFVHLCDYLASRKWLLYDFGDNAYNPNDVKKESEEDLAAKIENLIDLCKKKIAEGVNRDDLYRVIAEHNNEHKNPRTINSVDTFNEIRERIEKMEVANG